MLLETGLIGLILSGASIYSILKGEQEPKTQKRAAEDNYNATYDYFMKLTLDEQHKYINDNYDLRYYKSELLYDNKQSTARQVARRADKLGKPFNNRFKVY